MSDRPDRLPLTLLEGPLRRPAEPAQPPLAHVFERDSILAVNMALACGRPLLVRGEPGVGKSQLGRAVAAALERVFLSAFVDARTEAHDLMWFHDAVTRLAEAQAWAALPKEERGGGAESLSRARFVVPGPLWWALDWKSAEEHVTHPHVKKPPPAPESRNGVVLLIDEIDKADSSVPNGLLECLGQRTFAVPGLDQPVCAAGPAPLVILTTNDDRVLPDAFVRRCIVLHLRLPERKLQLPPDERDRELVKWLVARGRAHFGDMETTALAKAAEQLATDRARVQAAGFQPPGLAEYIDLLTALAEHPLDEVDDRIKDLARFVMDKHADPGPRAES